MSPRHLVIAVVIAAPFASVAAVEISARPVPGTIRFDSCSLPAWPTGALRRLAWGTVDLKVLVDEDGKVGDSIIRKSSGSADLDEAALRAIVRCKFHPPQHNGQGIRKWVPLQYVWPEHAPPSDKSLAEVRALSIAGSKGDGAALYRLGTMLAEGLGVAADPASADQVMQIAADLGHPEAAMSLATKYEFGRSRRPKDLVLAQRWYVKAAERGVADAQYRLATIALETEADSAKDVPGAVGWLRKAAGQDHAKAAYTLATMLAKGDGVQRDPAEAERLLRVAAAKDHSDAQYALAVALLRGDGVQANAAEAVRMLELAAEDRQSDAELLLAELKLEGKTVARDEAGGMQLLKRAAEGGNISAMTILGTMLGRGLLLPLDAAAGARWTSKAARYGALENRYSSGYFSQLIGR